MDTRTPANLIPQSINATEMSQNAENVVQKCEVVVEEVKNVENEKNYSTNTLKSVRKKIRNFTIRRKAHENLSSDLIDDQKEADQDKNSDESFGKSKITLKKIFRKSSFKKFISNIQHFTNFTVSRSNLAFIHKLTNESSRSGVVEKRRKKLSCLS